MEFNELTKREVSATSLTTYPRVQIILGYRTFDQLPRLRLQAQLNAERSVRAWAADHRPPRKGMELAIKAAADANVHLSTNYEKAKNKVGVPA